MRDYEVFLRVEAIEVLKQTRGQQRKLLSNFIDSLPSNPNQSGDYAEADETDRRIEMKVLEQVVVSFWADHAVREVKVIDIRRADRP